MRALGIACGRRSRWTAGLVVGVAVIALAARRDGLGAPSITIGVDSDTSLTLAYIHQDDDNTPIYGVPFFLSGVNDGPLPGVDDSDYFGIVNLDDEDTVAAVGLLEQAGLIAAGRGAEILA